MKGLLVLLLVAACCNICQAGKMYKYQDANGNWVFSDQPPQKEKNFETLTYTQDKKIPSKIQLYYVKNNQGYTLHAKNKLFAPIEIAITDPDTQKDIRKVVPARDSSALLHRTKNTGKLNFRWVLGEPNTSIENTPYHAPFSSPKGHRISQGFNGRYSHTNDYNRYAVDIAMDVGTYLTAVRPGTVVWVKDDYHMSGTTRYFLDKANVIKVLHEDGTFASYAHILMDTALVKEGDEVALGDRLARSGSSGFSTGPHLHFSIIRNVGLKNIAIPFQFIDDKGTAYTPKRAMIMVGANKP